MSIWNKSWEVETAKKKQFTYTKFISTCDNAQKVRGIKKNTQT